MIKRKSTWDTQSTVSHPYNYNVNPHPGQCVHRDTPTTTNTSPESTLPAKGYNLNSVSNHNPSSTTLNNSFPLTHHPYQKDYQEYLSRINALEKGDSPPPPRSNIRVETGNLTKTKLSATKPNSWKIGESSGEENDCPAEEEAQISMTSFITVGESGRGESFGSGGDSVKRVGRVLKTGGSDSGCSEDVEDVDVDSPLVRRKEELEKVEDIDKERTGLR